MGNAEVTPNMKRMLEELTGKPYEEVTLNDLDKISPGINRDLNIQNAKMVAGMMKHLGWQ